MYLVETALILHKHDSLGAVRAAGCLDSVDWNDVEWNEIIIMLQYKFTLVIALILVWFLLGTGRMPQGQRSGILDVRMRERGDRACAGAQPGTRPDCGSEGFT